MHGPGGADAVAGGDGLLGVATEEFGVTAPTLPCPPDAVQALASFLRDHGADSVIVAQLDYVFTGHNRCSPSWQERCKKRPDVHASGDDRSPTASCGPRMSVAGRSGNAIGAAAVAIDPKATWRLGSDRPLWNCGLSARPQPDAANEEMACDLHPSSTF